MEYIAESLLKYQKNKLNIQKNNDFDFGSNEKNVGSNQKKLVYQQKNLGSIKILSVLDLNLPPKGDISDWLEAGHTKEIKGKYNIRNE
ncbi:hypothetical protein FDN13_07115 [Caloramator sp. E03]|uniref:hypothetical protein n=1 Tax=Caloramator sp. E03 TaxID=2576307 RepID=UPI0011109A73|nr:hypothetical protein [Caloramator sp. E03]QCX33498.1 hypothetical protein FDN13_07115 [Caloramator sp. E03]